MTPQKFKSLLDGYYAGTLTDKERTELFALLHNPQYREQLEQLFTDDFTDPAFESVADTESMELVYQQIQLRKQAAPVRRIFPYRSWAIAAAVLLGVAAVSFFAFLYPEQKTAIAHTQGGLKNDIAAPAYTKAVLILSGGKEIMLGTVAGKQLAVDGNARIIQTGDGQLTYQTDPSLQANGAALINTLIVPKGSRPLQLILTDGTTVWLNAASSLTYPVAFTGHERKVQMTGEAYYEVAKDAARKFIVSANGVETEVLGTHFNINAYADEGQQKISLLEGAVRVSTGGQLIALKPGQQARIAATGKPETLSDIDTEEITAWKDGYFDFRSTDIKTVMRQLSRWYNAEIEYNGKITDNHFSGIINRNNNISQVLKMLQSTGSVGFKVEPGSSSSAGKIIVLP